MGDGENREVLAEFHLRRLSVYSANYLVKIPNKTSGTLVMSSVPSEC